MFLRLDKQLNIDNLNGYSGEIVAQLEELLTAGVEARLDPNRKNFYEVETAERVFFIHAAPVRSSVMLLAAWPREARLAELTGAAHTS